MYIVYMTHVYAYDNVHMYIYKYGAPFSLLYMYIKIYIWRKRFVDHKKLKRNYIK